MRRELDINMPGNEGSKKDGNFTKKEKWMVGVYIVTAITSTVLFVMTLIVMSQLKGQATDTQANASEHKSAASSASGGWEEKYNELFNRTNENERRTSKLIEGLQNKVEAMEKRTHQSEENAKILRSLQNDIVRLEGIVHQSEENAKILRSLQNDIVRLEGIVENAIGKSNKRYGGVLVMERWTKASNGFYYKVFRSSEKVKFETAENNCSSQGARLASTGLRNTTIRREILEKYNGEYVWIGLKQPYKNATWVWSDGRIFKPNDMQWGWNSCSQSHRYRGAVWGSSMELYCLYNPGSDVNLHLCEADF